jgi:hypothetical protein
LQAQSSNLSAVGDYTCFGEDKKLKNPDCRYGKILIHGAVIPIGHAELERIDDTGELGIYATDKRDKYFEIIIQYEKQKRNRITFKGTLNGKEIIGTGVYLKTQILLLL